MGLTGLPKQDYKISEVAENTGKMIKILPQRCKKQLIHTATLERFLYICIFK